MRSIISFIALILGTSGYGQNFAFHKEGKMRPGFVQMDTIRGYKARSTVGPFLFRKMDSAEHYPIPKRDSFFARIYSLGTDSVELFSLVNTGKTPIRLYRQDQSLIAIKEVPDSKGNWKPIEYWIHGICGNSYIEYTIMPGQALLMRTAKTYGTIKTKMRLRLRTESNGVILSEPFDAYFDASYFQVPSEMYTFPSPVEYTHLIPQMIVCWSCFDSFVRGK